MKDVIDFVLAALPWVLMGIAIALAPVIKSKHNMK